MKPTSETCTSRSRCAYTLIYIEFCGSTWFGWSVGCGDAMMIVVALYNSVLLCRSTNKFTRNNCDQKQENRWQYLHWFLIYAILYHYMDANYFLSRTSELTNNMFRKWFVTTVERIEMTMTNMSMMLFDKILLTLMHVGFKCVGVCVWMRSCTFYDYLIYVTILIQHLPLGTWQLDKSKILGMVLVLLSQVSNQWHPPIPEIYTPQNRSDRRWGRCQSMWKRIPPVM